jgi:hypothetical protein
MMPSAKTLSVGVKVVICTGANLLLGNFLGQGVNMMQQYQLKQTDGMEGIPMVK